MAQVVVFEREVGLKLAFYALVEHGTGGACLMIGELPQLTSKPFARRSRCVLCQVSKLRRCGMDLGTAIVAC